jgi:hypothetical protein
MWDSPLRLEYLAAERMRELDEEAERAQRGTGPSPSRSRRLRRQQTRQFVSLAFHLAPLRLRSRGHSGSQASRA